MRRCFIHVGMHKTGTKTLQYTLSTQKEKLDTLGYHYPPLGRPPMHPHGHHNIAWELANDARFRKEFGTTDDLMAEIAAAPGDIVLSSEDFECSAHHPASFKSFVERLTEGAFEVKFVAYFRNQIEYAESLYLTMLQFGFAVPFDEYIDEILRNGQFQWRDWTFAFDYDAFTERLRSIGGEPAVRSYDAVRSGGLLNDFLSIIGLAAADLELREEIFLNQRRPAPALVDLFYRNRTGRPLTDLEQVALVKSFQFVPARLEMSERSKRNFVEKFAASNKRLVENFRIPAFAAMRPEALRAASDPSMSMDKIFSDELSMQAAPNLGLGR